MAKVKDTSISSRIFDVMIWLVMAFMLIICVVPFVYMIALSLSSAKAIINGKVSFWPVELNLEAYSKIFTYPNFFRAYGNTIFYTVVGTAIALVMTILFAYPLSKSYLKGHGFFTKVVIFSMYFSGGLIPNYLFDFLNRTHRNTVGDHSPICNQPVQPDNPHQFFQGPSNGD